MSDGLTPVRYHMRGNIAVEHVQDRTYKWVHAVTGQYLGYVLAEEIVYEPTVERQMARSRKP